MIARLWAHPDTRHLKFEVGRFAMVGMANALLTFVIFFSLLKLLHVNYLLSLFTSWLCGMFFSYCLNFIWVFSQAERLTFDVRFVKFAVSGITSISVNMIGLRLLVDATGYDPFWIQTALIPPVVAFNFLTAKLWSLVRRDG